MWRHRAWLIRLLEVDCAHRRPKHIHTQRKIVLLLFNKPLLLLYEQPNLNKCFKCIRGLARAHKYTLHTKYAQTRQHNLHPEQFCSICSFCPDQIRHTDQEPNQTTGYTNIYRSIVTPTDPTMFKTGQITPIIHYCIPRKPAISRLHTFQYGALRGSEELKELNP